MPLPAVGVQSGDGMRVARAGGPEPQPNLGAHRRSSLDRQLVSCHTSYVQNADLTLDVELVKALASDKRLLILEWLRDPEAHFPAQRDGDLVRDGVCSLFIADKLGVSQPTCGEHLRVLSRAGLIRGTKIRQWVFYQRDEARIAAAKELLSGDW
jgi:DNA-binding transcriptional ArsR family regulator